MNDSIRKLLHLSQERMASWLGLDRTAVAHAEARRRHLPMGTGVQDSRLTMAAYGQVLTLDGHAAPVPLPLPPPTPARAPFERRLYFCHYHIGRLQRALTKLRHQAAPYEARLVAAPCLRAWTGPVARPALEASWLELFEYEATTALANVCGAGPQRLLAARLAGLEREAELLAEALAELPPA